MANDDTKPAYNPDDFPEPGPTLAPPPEPEPVPDPTKPPAPDLAQKKVELDLDGAPFLERATPAIPGEENQVEEADAPEQEPDSPAALPAAQEKRKKTFILAGAAALVLIVAFVGLNLLFRTVAPPPDVPPPPEMRVIPETTLPPPVPRAAHQISWEPFWAEQKDTEGEIRFVICQFTIPTESQAVYHEMLAKEVILRDAVFYYLRNRRFQIQSDERALNVLKSELITVINEHLATGKIEDMYMGKYLVTNPKPTPR